MQNKKVLVLVILSISAVISLIYGVTAPPKRRTSVSPNAVAASRAGSIPSAAIIVPTQRTTKKTKFTSWGRNPFAPTGIAGAAGSKPVLNGIVWDNQSPTAILNDDIVGIGDKVGTNTVVDITPNSVVLNDGTENFELRLAD